MAEMLREVRTAIIEQRLGWAFLFAPRPVGSFLLFGQTLTLKDFAFGQLLRPPGPHDAAVRQASSAIDGVDNDYNKRPTMA